MTISRILLSSGEPAGVGPDLVIQVAQETWPVELSVIGDPDLLLSRARKLKLPLTLLPFHSKTMPEILPPGHLKLIPLSLREPCEAGKLNRGNASYVVDMLEQAAQAALNHSVAALVTAPVHKGILNEACIPFQGHTEFFAAKAGVKKALMLFVLEKLKVALVTTHLPLAKVPQAVIAEVLEETLRLLRQGLITQFKIKDPEILVCGLNPHAGEGGHLGREEIEIITPVLEKLRGQSMKLTGPLAADTIFTEKYLAQADAVLAMYHDQALPVVKTLGFGQAVNVTLGLPFIRTSVDHGTALDVAGTLKSDASSLRAALRLAIRNSKNLAGLKEG